RIHVRARLPPAGARGDPGDDPPHLRRPALEGADVAGGDRLSRGHDGPLRARVLMARIKDSSVEAVKAAAEILPLVEDYVRLRKAGGTYKGLCPFYERLLWDGEHAAFAREYLASRGLRVEVCKQFRLGYAPGGPTLARRALQEGYTQDELLAAGLANRRGNDYFNRRIVFPLADARGQVRGFQARKLYDDDPLQAKYVNSAESELFKKGDLLYGLDTGRQAIAKQDRAVVVEGNTDVIALRQADFEPVVAAMGTALTEAQLKELNRLTKRLFLCFDADAAGQDATLRGMELAVARGFDVKIVTLPKGTDPADDPVEFEQE